MPVDFGPMNRAVAAAFATTATIAGLGDVPAIFDSRSYLDPNGEAGASTVETTIAVTDDIAAAVEVVDQADVATTAITVNGIAYVVADKRPLGGGMTSLVLWKAP
jgi:hypothetical protein